jgi:hypothetical protein
MRSREPNMDWRIGSIDTYLYLISHPNNNKVNFPNSVPNFKNTVSETGITNPFFNFKTAHPNARHTEYHSHPYKEGVGERGIHIDPSRCTDIKILKRTSHLLVVI